MRFIRSISYAIGAVALLSGCATAPAPEGQISAAYAVGDRTRVALDEVVVSLPLKGVGTYQNLHVHLAATINPVKSTPYSSYTVSDIIQRLEARINARLLEVLSELKQPAIEDMAALRTQAAREAQAVVDDAMRRWQHGPEYEVKILVVSLYWTDNSVGRASA